ncbi:A/G-specific adenine glycosylase [Paenibacillus glycanilyticus]|uniref:A/G-specific adenine glycosylase n=1 Tax=Paenibacillus glycanilyticus TaxID=126569 RepID=UPI00203B0BDA|nr:A/G-specific adenine glycosylase [Paenibacillus glycanilyticus]MCM3630530.1 A/G-specific adenine glycosylase [Paenibacillus glycanilyticus]
MEAINNEEAKAYFSRELLIWYRRIKRDLPWRMNQDPYRVWVSEIMLQQTRVDTVIPYYERFMTKFPTVRTLAEAPEPEVLKCWEGLGYYSRARNLQAGAREVVERYGGVVPDDKTAVSGLKGVGPYTTGAIMSIAFNRPEPAVDGNVMRVLSRYFCLEDDIAKPATRVNIEKLAGSLIPEGAAGDFNQALMELGALVCTPKSPSCLPCPVMEHCAARLAGREAELPIKTKAKPPRPEKRAAVIVAGTGVHEGKILIRQRPETGLLAQMWELPHLLIPKEQESVMEAADELSSANAAAAGKWLTRSMEAETGLLIRPRRWLMDADHVFSHIHWKMRIYLADLGTHAELADAPSASLAAESAAAYEAEAEGKQGEYRWIGPADMETLAFPNLFIRILRDYWT